MLDNKFFYIKRYEESDKDLWDSFIENDSINGTFLQSRRFLNYHPIKRFEDASFLIYNLKDQLCAICPACISYEANKKILFAHKGSTFGGLIFNNKNYNIEKVLQIVKEMELYLTEEGFDEVCLRITSSLFSIKNNELLQYVLHYYNYTEYLELGFYIDFNNYKEDLLSNLSQGKRTNINNCLKAGLDFRELETEAQIEELYDVLCKNLEKYDTKPVHTLEELKDLKNNRIAKECVFFGVFDNTKIIAGAMLFYFNIVNVAHTQYLCSLKEYDRLSPMTFLYYNLIKKIKSMGFKYLSWGIATENYGKKINIGLSRNKESFNSLYHLNKTFRKVL